ncbi:reverse transcriptase [Rhynchospora pubera]|uniref:Reverse transcriptase n=1 Tax=Rhynchospora pubera TaxID=906938 RepID=A0AAV8DUX3_9POAL|nr:reverse transcriptase [Rhynchospora pubera]
MGVLSSRFKDLFTYCQQPDITVADFSANQHRPFVLFKPSISSSASTIQQLNSLLEEVQNLPSSIDTLSSTAIDTVHWSLSSGTFTAASLYNFLNLLPKIPSNLRFVWKLKVPPRVITFTWLMLQDKLPTVDNLQKRWMVLVNQCSLCRVACESSSHLFNCSFFISTRSLVLNQSEMHYQSLPPLHELMTDKGFPIKVAELFALTCFWAWKERCSRIFKNLASNPDSLASLVLDDWTLCQTPRH